MERLEPLLARYAFPVLWATLPFTAGPSLADALDPRSDSVRSGASIGLWAIWAVTLVAGLIPRTVTLTLIRITAPASLVAVIWATMVDHHRAGWTVVAIGFTFAVTIAALIPPTADTFVNGSSYGDERRLALRPPGQLLLGPIQITWAAVVAGAVAGPLLLTAHQWIPGAIVLVVGWAAAIAGIRSLHVLSQRWVVFVPAGVVIVDRLSLADALLVPKASVASIGPAPADSTARDLTAGATGLALQIDFAEEMGIVPIPRRRLRGDQPASSLEPVTSVLFSPSRPGTVLHEAARRRLRVTSRV